MEKIVTVVNKNGVECTVSLTAQEADFYLRVAQLRALSSDDVMREFSNLLISKNDQDTQHNKVQYN
ncbi:MAG: hypothetical protein PVS3B3_08350 [Ktedonobacteraceae bacterium]